MTTDNAHRVTVAERDNEIDLECEVCCWARRGIRDIARAEMLADEHELRGDQ
jgi:hypothetical protein